jgi:hypothetical protein
LQPGLGVLRDNHLHDIEPKKYVGIAEQTQPGKTATGNSFSFLSIDRIERPSEILPGPGFDLHENQSVAIAADEVDLPTRSATKVTRQNFVTVPAEEPGG